MRALSNTALVEQAARKALSAQELEKTLSRFRQLCVTSGDDLAPSLEETADVLREAGFKHELMQILRDSLVLPEANPHVGALWIRRIATSKVWNHRYPTELDTLCQQGEVGYRAVIEFLDIVGAKRRWKLVQQTVSRHAKWLRTHPLGWAAAGRALTRARSYSQAAKWMSNWREQPDLDLPTLQCLALSLRATRRSSAAAEVVRLALAQAGSNEAGSLFRLYAAEDDLFAGNLQAAALHFKHINNSGWDDDSLALYYLLRGLIRVEKAEPPDRPDVFAAAQERMRDLFRRVPIYKRDVFLRSEYRRCVTKMAKASGQGSEAIRAVWHSAQSWSFLLPLLLIPGLQLFLPCYLYRLCARRRGVNR
jgi:hypothetical protein